MLETNGEHIPQPDQRRIIRLPGTVLQRDITIASEYGSDLLDPNALLNPALVHDIIADDYLPDLGVWAG